MNFSKMSATVALLSVALTTVGCSAIPGMGELDRAEAEDLCIREAENENGNYDYGADFTDVTSRQNGDLWEVSGIMYPKGEEVRTGMDVMLQDLAFRFKCETDGELTEVPVIDPMFFE